MMKRFLKTFSILTITCLVIASAAGCKGKNQETNASGSVAVNETKKETQKESETEKTTSTESESTPETKPFFEESRPAIDIEIPDDVENMRPLLTGLCKTMAGGKTYDGSNSEFLWESLYAAINGSDWIHPQIRLSDDGSGYVVPGGVMSEYASAMFGGKGDLTDIPASMGGIEFNGDIDSYIVYSSDGYSGYMDITAVNETADGYEVSVAFTTKKGSVENHTFALSKGGAGSFPCSITGVIE